MMQFKYIFVSCCAGKFWEIMGTWNLGMEFWVIRHLCAPPYNALLIPFSHAPEYVYSKGWFH